MEESEREGEEQVYDFIGNASDENSNEIEGVERTSAGEESLETGTDEVDQGLAASPTEDTFVEKKEHINQTQGEISTS